MKEEGVFVPWDDKYAIGVPDVDEQHRELLNLTNALYETCNEGGAAAGDAFRKAAHSIVEYVKVHFSAEEEMMGRCGYPEGDAHKEEHKAFVLRFLEEVRAFEEGKPFVVHSFARFLKDWILRHIAITDRRMGNFFSKHGHAP